MDDGRGGILESDGSGGGGREYNRSSVIVRCLKGAKLTADVELEKGRGGITGAPLPPGKYILFDEVVDEGTLLLKTSPLLRVVKLFGREKEETRAAAPGKGMGRLCLSDVKSALVILVCLLLFL